LGLFFFLIRCCDEGAWDAPYARCPLAQNGGQAGG